MKTIVLFLVPILLLVACAGATEEVDDLSRAATKSRDAGADFVFDGSHGPCINCTR